MDKALKQIVGADRLSKYVDSDYLGSGQLDLDRDYVLTIDKLWQGKISTGGKAEQQVVISFRERYVDGVEVKPMILNATNRRTLKTLFGGDSADKLEGKAISVYVETGVRDPRTGGTTEGLRIRARRPTAPKTVQLICSDCGNPVTDSQGIPAAQIAQVAERRHNCILCADCLAKRKNEAAAQEVPAEQEATENE